jgi:uncharacterized protein DUF4349
MNAPVHLVSLATSRRRAAAPALLLAAGACVLAAGCSAGGSSAGATMGTAAAPGRAASGVGAGAVHAAPAPAAALRPASGASGAGTTAGLAAVPLPGGQSVIFTASLSLRTRDVPGTVARATRLAESADGYVSRENARVVQAARHATPVVNIQFKVPAAAYQPTLTALSGLGTKRSETQQAQDVTGTVADVNSRVASAQAAIAQLRRLLTRAGSVGGLLNVQEQINQEEASLEALQSQQRALARETTYATISLTVTRTAPPPARSRHHQAGAGFLRGLTAGWHALRTALTWLLTVAGAMLPFLVPAGLVAVAAIVGRRWWLGRRRASASPAAD